jgi:hypothetical protein
MLGESINVQKEAYKIIGQGDVTIPPCQKDKGKDLEKQFCCKLDNLCWPNLGECFTNCPCKINCQPAPAKQ